MTKLGPGVDTIFLELMRITYPRVKGVVGEVTVSPGLWKWDWQFSTPFLHPDWSGGGALGFRARWQGLAGCGGGDLGIGCLGNHVMYTQTGKGTLTALSWEQAELPPVLSLASGEAPLLSRVNRKALDP